ncbi:MAG TPA: hypothetical protein DCM40_24525, partial [Maribacter sp.]|nr:hypothetical protein [Maribacter sp.]
MTQKLTKNILVKLIKEEIIKVHLTEQTMGKITKAEIDRRISNAQGQIRFYQRDLRQMRKQGLGVPGGEKLNFRVDRAKGLDYPTGTNTLGKASRFANKMIKKFNKEISDLKGLPQYAAALSVAGQPGIATAPPPPGSALSPTPMPKLRT